MTIYNGPAVTDTAGATPGSALQQSLLNAFLLVQMSYLINSPTGIASSATAANPPVINQPALQEVINCGIGIAFIQPTDTTVTCAAGPVSQDNYVDVDNSGAYHVTMVAAGLTPGAVASNMLRLYFARTNGSNSAVSSFTNVANTNPLVSSSAMLTDGSNAAALVTLADNLTVGGTTTLNGDVYNNQLIRFVSTPTLSAAFGAAAGSGPSGLTVNGTANAGNVTFTTGSSPTSGTLLTLSYHPTGSQVMLGVLFTNTFNAGGTSRYVSQTVVSLAAGTYSVGITISAALAAGTAYTLSYMILWG